MDMDKAISYIDISLKKKFDLEQNEASFVRDTSKLL